MDRQPRDPVGRVPLMAAEQAGADVRHVTDGVTDTAVPLFESGTDVDSGTAVLDAGPARRTAPGTATGAATPAFRAFDAGRVEPPIGLVGGHRPTTDRSPIDLSRTVPMLAQLEAILTGLDARARAKAASINKNSN